MLPITVGTKLYFCRPEHEDVVYNAVVTGNYRKYGGDFNYTIKSNDYPYIIGFASEDELFIDLQSAMEAVKPYKRLRLLDKIHQILTEKSMLEDTLSALEIEIQQVETDLTQN